jgi:hypothetical protein
MTDNQLNVRLVVSKRMDENPVKERDILRTPKMFRESHTLPGKAVVMKSKLRTVNLATKKALSGDIREQLRLKRLGKITRDQFLRTVFVTTETFHKLINDKRIKSSEGAYVSNDIEALKIGADPEFALVNPDTGKLMYASRTGAIPGPGELGYDGPLAEVRPQPHKTTGDIVTNIKDIFDRGQSRISNYDWISGASYFNEHNDRGRIYHLGGHIHIGDPIELEDRKREAAYEAIIQVLDNMIALPLVRIDTPEPHRRRNEEWNGYGPYGRSGDQRPQEGRFEWRVLSGLWLAHPTLATAILGTTKAVSEACYKSMAERGFDLDWIKSEEGFRKYWKADNKQAVAKAINDAVPSKVSKAMANKSVNKLKELSNYKQYQSEIKEFEVLVNMSANDRKNINLDLKQNWLNGAKLIKEK